MQGPERRSVEIDKKNKTITAYHESGHAIVAYFTKDAMPINKATIMPRGPTLGHVSFSLHFHSLVKPPKTQSSHLSSYCMSCRCLCFRRMTAGVRPGPSCWLRWTSVWVAGWRRSSSLEMSTLQLVSGWNHIVISMLLWWHVQDEIWLCVMIFKLGVVTFIKCSHFTV